MLSAFPPLIGSEPSILVLGSMPSRRSLGQQQYYAHPQNSFWWIMSHLCRFDLSLDYSEKVQAVVNNGVAIWDVLRHCEREGSLDASIERESEVSNDFSEFLSRNANINHLIFNGQAAFRIFRRHHPELARSSKLSTIVCPSTSPANAKMKKQEKLALWREAFINAGFDVGPNS